MRKKETVKGPKTSAPYLAVIHRLDQPVEGILVFGKTKNAAASLTRQLTRNGFKNIMRPWPRVLLLPPPAR